MAVDAGIYNVRKATCIPPCVTCNGTTTYWVSIDPFGVFVNGQTQEYLQAQWNNGAQYDYTSNSSWGSSNTSIATVQTGLVKGASSGSFTVNAGTSGEPVYTQLCGYYAPSCPVAGGGGGSAPGNVQVPKYFFTSGAFTNTTSGCASNQAGSTQNIQYYVAAQDSSRISMSGITPLEEVTLNGVVENSWSSYSTPVNTLADGSFNDDPVGSCFGPPAPTGNVCSYPSQAFEAKDNGTTYSISTYTQRKDCSQGQQTSIQGNPTGYNHVYTQGTVQ